MKREQFIYQLRRKERGFRWITFWGLSALGLVFIGLALTDFLEERGHIDSGAATLVARLLCGTGVVGFLAYFVTALSLQRGVECPHCRKALFGMPAQLVVATGVCGKCGEKVLD